MSTSPEAPAVIGTAGHVDHGKTTLVLRLTGIDTDRLAEEKRRGITIVLGFAPLDLPSGRRVGLIDVPGHERFVKNMVAGAGGIDLALLVVAADEGVMPQTREHLEILGLLGVERGVVALTKIDRARDLVDMAIDDVRSALAGSSLAAAPIVALSAQTGEGIDALLAALDAGVASIPERATNRPAFFPIDRAFTVKGFGSVVTGTLEGGAVTVGDELELSPERVGHPVAGPLKVRGLQVFGKKVERALPGQRVAINLHGIELDAIEVGQSLVSTGAAIATRRLTVRLQHLASRKRPLKSGAKVHFASGTAQVPASVTLLDVDELAPGERGFATIRLRAPIATLYAKRFILRGFERGSGTGRTLGGGVILDAEPPRRRRKHASTLSAAKALEALLDGDAALPEAVAALVEERAAGGLSKLELARRLTTKPHLIDKAVKTSAVRDRVIEAGDRLVSAPALEALGDKVLAALAAFHLEQPFRAGAPATEILSRLGKRQSTPVVERAISGLIGKKRVTADQEGFRVAGHRPRLELDPTQREKVLSALQGLEPPTGSELETKTGLPTKTLRDVLTALAREGAIVHTGEGLYFSRPVYETAKEKLLDFAGREGGVTTAQAKTLFGISRKYLIPLLESFDKLGVTVRKGETRLARPKR